MGHQQTKLQLPLIAISKEAYTYIQQWKPQPPTLPPTNHSIQQRDKCSRYLPPIIKAATADTTTNKLQPPTNEINEAASQTGCK